MKLGITMLIHNKDDIEFVTEFPCFLGHPVYYTILRFLEMRKTCVQVQLHEFRSKGKEVF